MSGWGRSIAVAALLASSVACAQTCAADKDCPGELVCERGQCATMGGPGIAPPAATVTPVAPAPAVPSARPPGLPGVRGEACAHSKDCVSGLICKAQRCEVQEDRELEKKVYRGLAIGGLISFVASYLTTLVVVESILATSCKGTCTTDGTVDKTQGMAVLPFVGPLQLASNLDTLIDQKSAGARPLMAFGLYVGEFFEIIGPVVGITGLALLIRTWNIEAAELAVVPVAGKDFGGFALGGRFDLTSLFVTPHQDLP